MVGLEWTRELFVVNFIKIGQANCLEIEAVFLKSERQKATFS